MVSNRVANVDGFDSHFAPKTTGQDKLYKLHLYIYKALFLQWSFEISWM